MLLFCQIVIVENQIVSIYWKKNNGDEFFRLGDGQMSDSRVILPQLRISHHLSEYKGDLETTVNRTLNGLIESIRTLRSKEKMTFKLLECHLYWFRPRMASLFTKLGR